MIVKKKNFSKNKVYTLLICTPGIHKIVEKRDSSQDGQVGKSCVCLFSRPQQNYNLTEPSKKIPWNLAGQKSKDIQKKPHWDW